MPALPLALGGFSFGGYVAAQAAERLAAANAPAQRLVLIGPATSTFPVPAVPADIIGHSRRGRRRGAAAATLDWARPQGCRSSCCPAWATTSMASSTRLRDLVLRGLEPLIRRPDCRPQDLKGSCDVNSQTVLAPGCWSSVSAWSQAQPLQPPEVAARNYLLIDLNADQVLAEREADARVDPASLTKLMTAYLVFNAISDKKLSLEQTLPVSVRAWTERKGGGSLMFIDPKMTPKVDELLQGHDRGVGQRRGGGARRRVWRQPRRLRCDDEPAGPGLRV